MILNYIPQITTYVWDNLEIGYMQGMCDLVAPILVTFDDEALTYACFSKLMQRMIWYCLSRRVKIITSTAPLSLAATFQLELRWTKTLPVCEASFRFSIKPCITPSSRVETSVISTFATGIGFSIYVNS